MIFMLRGLILSIVISMCGLSYAQTHYVPHITVGGHAGMTMSNVTFSPGVEQKFAMGYMFGASFTYAEERHVGLRVELNMTQRGWREDFEEYNSMFSYERKLTYVTLPVMTHIFFGGRRVKCIINLGPEVGYLLSDKITSNFDYMNLGSVSGFPNSNRHNEQLYMEINNRFDYGISGGIGIEFVINRRNSIQLEGRYYFGLGNIYPAAKKDVFGASRNQTISASLSYMFRLK